MSFESLPNKLKPRAVAVDFFCGAGGVSKGFIDAGIHVLAGIDIDQWCEGTYTDTKNNKNKYDGSIPEYLKYDIRKNGKEADYEKLLNKLEELIKPWKEIPLIFVICPPCQPFTRLTKIQLAEKTSKQRDQDKNLFDEMSPYIERFKPLMIFSENVPGIRNEKSFGPVYRNFLQLLQKNGFVIGSNLVNAKYFNVPQKRIRNILLAVHSRHWTEKKLEPPEAIEVPKKHPGFVKFLTVRDVLGTSANPTFPPLKAGEAHPKIPNHRAANLSDKNLLRIRFAKPGKTNEVLSETKYGDLRVECHKKADSNGNKNHHSDVYSRMDPRKSAPTITTKCFSISNGRYGYPYMNQDRAISLREAAVLQSFPNSYRFHSLEGLIQVGKQIGNAVPPKLAEFFGNYLLDLLKG